MISDGNEAGSSMQQSSSAQADLRADESSVGVLYSIFYRFPRVLIHLPRTLFLPPTLTASHSSNSCPPLGDVW